MPSNKGRMEPGSLFVRHGRGFSHILRIPVIVFKYLLSPPLAMLFRRIWLKWGHVIHLETSIRFSVMALSSTPKGHPRLAHYQLRLAVSLRDRYKRRGRVWDLHLAISLQKSSLIVVSPSDPDLEWHQQNLAVSYEYLYSRSCRLEDLKTSLDFQQYTFSTLSDKDTGRGWWMKMMAWTYSKLYTATGKLDYLESGVHWATLCLENTPNNQRDLLERQIVLNGLLIDRSKYCSDIGDADKAILLNEQALKTIPVGTTEYYMTTMNLALSYNNRYERIKARQDLDSSLNLAVTAMNNLPRDDHYYCQFALVTSQEYLHKYHRDYDVADLHHALKYCQTGMDTINRDKTLLGLCKGLMAIIHHGFYQRFGSMSDLELAIDLCMSAISLLPPNHVKLAFHQLNLSTLYFEQYRRHQDAQRLQSALHWGNLALESAVISSSLYIDCLHHLSLIYRLKVEVTRDTRDLDQALNFMQSVLDATPHDSHDLPGRYSSMALLYSTRYNVFGGPKPREQILTYMRAAVEAAEKLNDPDLPVLQNSLALQYLNRYLWLREESDLNSALHFSELSTNSTPEDHFSGAHRYTVLASIYTEKFALDHEEEIKKLTLNAYRRASMFTASNPDSQWSLAQKWALFTDSIHSPEALDAYRHAFNVLPALLWLGTNITTQHEALVKYDVSKMASNATVSCILNENYEAALEFLEQSLSVTFNQLLDLQTDLSLLETRHPNLANSLRQISDDLRQLATTTMEGDEGKLDKVSSQSSDRLRKLALERDGLLKQVRAIPDFEHFLLPLPFSDLREAASRGPIVAITSTHMRCDVLIVLNANSFPLHLRLFRVNTPTLQTQYQRLKMALKDLGIHTRYAQEVDRGGRVSRLRTGPEQTKLDEVLEWLYLMVVAPIYDLLRKNGITGGRLWWCPTGPLTYFPLHAAGPPNKFIPSYTSTLNSLVRGRSRQFRLATDSNVTVIGMSESPDGNSAPLPSVMKEIKAIKEFTLHHTIITNSEATINKVVAELPGSGWLHLACHGQQGNPKEPLNSCLLLYDDKLYLKQLLSMPLPNAEFVFLSACETAMGDTTMSNEALHLAGGMLFAGFRAAIATLWSINDDDGPVVARVVYEHMFMPDAKRTVDDSAEALWKAVEYLRSMGVPTYRWVPFIHIGV